LQRDGGRGREGEDECVLIEADEDEVERFELPAWEPLANLAAALRALLNQ